MKADPLLEQVQIETCTSDVLPEHLKTENVVDDLVNELKKSTSPGRGAQTIQGSAGRRSRMMSLSAILHATPSRLLALQFEILR